MNNNILQRVIRRAETRQEERDKVLSEHIKTINKLGYDLERVRGKEKRLALVVDAHQMTLLGAERKKAEKRAECIMDYDDAELCSTVWTHRRKTNKMKDEICGICMETHEAKHLVRTTCGHIFGKQCFSTLVEFHYNNYDEVLPCPMCRSTDYDLLRYKMIRTNKK